MRGGESRLYRFDEGERARWLRIRSTHLELWKELLMVPTEPGKPRTQSRLAAATARKAQFGHFIIGNIENLQYSDRKTISLEVF